MDLLDLPSYVKHADHANESVRLPVYIKYAVRCVTSCVRHSEGVEQLISSDSAMLAISQLILILRDEEIVANSSKILRVIFREEKHYVDLVKKHADLGNLLCETMALFQFSEVVMTELVGCCRNYCRSQQAAS